MEDTYGVWSYEDLGREALCVAGRLISAGLELGDVVALDGPLDRHFLACAHGIWEAGGAIAPMNEGWTGRERAQALELVAPRWIIQDPQGETFQRNGQPVSSIPNLLEYDEAGAAAYILTSGTTGGPKVVGISHGNLRASAMASKERLDLSAGDRWSASLSPAHVGGIALITRAALLRSTLVLRGPF